MNLAAGRDQPWERVMIGLVVIVAIPYALGLLDDADLAAANISDRRLPMLEPRLPTNCADSLWWWTRDA